MSDRQDRRGPAAVPLHPSEDEAATGRRRRGRVVLAVAIAVLLELGILWVTQNRRAGPPRRPAATLEPAAASAEPPAPIDIDLRRESDEAASRLALTLELASTTEFYQPAEIPVFDDPPPLPRDRLSFSAALGDGDAGRAGVHVDDLAPQLAAAVPPPPATPGPVREVSPSLPAMPYPAASPRRRVPPSPPLSNNETPDDGVAAAGDADLIDLQIRAVAEAVAQAVPVTRVPPRERPLLTPEQAAAAARAAALAESRQFFSEVTQRMMQVNQQALAQALRAGPRDTVDVRFSVDAEGRVGEPTAVSPAASPELAALAERIVAATSPMPRPPAALVRGGPLRLTYPVQVYR